MYTDVHFLPPMPFLHHLCPLLFLYCSDYCALPEVTVPYCHALHMSVPSLILPTQTSWLHLLIRNPESKHTSFALDLNFPTLLHLDFWILGLVRGPAGPSHHWDPSPPTTMHPSHTCRAEEGPGNIYPPRGSRVEGCRAEENGSTEAHLSLSLSHTHTHTPGLIRRQGH